MFRTYLKQDCGFILEEKIPVLQPDHNDNISISILFQNYFYIPNHIFYKEKDVECCLFLAGKGKNNIFKLFIMSGSDFYISIPCN